MFLLLHLATALFVVQLNRKFWEEQTHMLVGSWLSHYILVMLYTTKSIFLPLHEKESCNRITLHVRLGMKFKHCQVVCVGAHGIVASGGRGWLCVERCNQRVEGHWVRRLILFGIKLLPGLRLLGFCWKDCRRLGED